MNSFSTVLLKELTLTLYRVGTKDVFFPICFLGKLP